MPETISETTRRRETDARDGQIDIAQLERFANNLDSKFRIPGTSIRFGYDSIVGLVPGLGDVVTLAPATYLIWQGRKAGVRQSVLLRMGVNTGLDFFIGAIPVIGDLFDVGFKANRRNVALLRRELEQQATA